MKPEYPHRVIVYWYIKLSDNIRYRGLVSSVGIGTGYGLDGPGIESLWGRDFSHTSRPDLGPTQPPAQWVPFFPGGKAAGAWC
jgi:hypothetical protein